jgi:hypothetical protein
MDADMIQTITGSFLVVIIFTLVIILGMMVLIRKSMRRMQSEMERKLSLFPEPPRISQDIPRQEVQRMHAFSVETPKVLEENTEIRRKNIVRIKTVGEKKQEAILAKLPALAKMGNEQLKRFFNAR